MTKILIEGELEVISGLHIGADRRTLALSSADAPLIRDPRSGMPYVPGSSLKGKLRTLLRRALQNRVTIQQPENDPEAVCRLFGTPSTGGKPGQRGRLLIADAPLIETTVPDFDSVTEIKAEGAIDRTNGAINPRTVERVIPGTAFRLRLVYDVVNIEEVGEDLHNLAGAMELLAMDYLGGHGTRGSGRIGFKNMSVRQIHGDVLDTEDLRILNEVFADAALNL